jgi:hypothetical protein
MLICVYEEQRVAHKNAKTGAVFSSVHHTNKLNQKVHKARGWNVRSFVFLLYYMAMHLNAADQKCHGSQHWFVTLTLDQVHSNNIN